MPTGSFDPEVQNIGESTVSRTSRSSEYRDVVCKATAHLFSACLRTNGRLIQKAEMLTQYDDPCHGAQVVTQSSENRVRSNFLVLAYVAQYFDMIVDFPVVLQRQVPTFQTIKA